MTSFDCDPEKLEQQLSEPAQRTIDALDAIDGDIMVLGAGGKMGPSTARMAQSCFDATGSSRKVFAVSRFSDPAAREKLAAAGVETIAGDLMDEHFVSSLPDSKNVIFMVGKKFGTSVDQSETWATNAYLPGVVCRLFRQSRIVCLSTGNVYGLVDVASGGSRENDPLNPAGEYAQSCVARERVFEYFSRKYQLPVAVIRLNYATELRYGVLVDLAQKIYAEQPVALEMGYFNVIWQSDACELTLRSLQHAQSLPAVFNVTGPDVISCREVCQRLAQVMGKQVHFTGSESSTALLSDATRASQVLGRPSVTLDEMIDWTARWIVAGGPTWNKPTHFEVRSGSY